MKIAFVISDNQPLLDSAVACASLTRSRSMSLVLPAPAGSFVGMLPAEPVKKTA